MIFINPASSSPSNKKMHKHKTLCEEEAKSMLLFNQLCKWSSCIL